MLEVVQFEQSDSVRFLEARRIRELVFIKEQQVPERDEFDEFESDCVHYLLQLNRKPIGTARWRFIGDSIKLERFAVLKEYRNQQYGKVLLEKVIEDASKTNKPLYLHAQLKAVPFYQRSSFTKVGNMFVECDIEHFKMVLE